MQNARIAARLVGRQAVFLFKDDDADSRVRLGELVGRGQTDDSPAHDNDIRGFHVLVCMDLSVAVSISTNKKTRIDDDVNPGKSIGSAKLGS